ncbi:hypothetical protein F7725_019492 [Dissostichus mawsoni]|uniref:Uncharacterized protein n=1 Tax=Dissostichus mawsoni TaxID=36200 RepID=A0A7J5YKR9_DISMA|nr:hypothetical protein F7725_019492 [Dissostichus mawsoni]
METENSNLTHPLQINQLKEGIMELKCKHKLQEIHQTNKWKQRTTCGSCVLTVQEKSSQHSFNNSKKLGLEFHVGFGAKQNIRVDNLRDAHLLEVAKFALAMNSSKQDFIMEILEHNFNFGLQSEYQRNIFTLEIMNRVRMLENSKDAIKFSNEICVLPILPGMGNLKLQNIFHRGVDIYPFCHEIGLKLNVNNHQPNKKLDINKLTNGSVAEVTNFAEKLCGTFEQICLDILTHNFDFHLQSGDPDLARSIVARIHATVEQRNLTRYVKPFKGPKNLGKEPLWGKLKLTNNLNTDGCSAGSSHTAITNQEVGSSAVEHKNELDLKLESIDFNVGSGEKLNLDPKSLTKGIMVELNTFATALISDQKHFVTEILEYNFPLDLKNELYRGAYKEQLWKT